MTSPDPRFLALAIDPLSRGGIGAYTSQFLSGLARVWPGSRGHLVTLNLHARDEVPAGWAVHCTLTRRKYVLDVLRHAVRDRPTEIVIFHIFLLPLGLLAALLCGARTTVVVYGWDVSRNRRPIQRLLANYVDRVVAISRRTAIDAEAFVARCGRKSGDVAVLPPTIDAVYYCADEADGAAFRAAFGFAEDDILLVTVGRLESSERSKGHDRVIRVLPALLRDNRSLRYVIVGEGDDAGRLRELANEVGVAQAVTFVGYYENLQACYSAADVFVMPSTQEGFGIVFLEAMACGVRVVAGGVDGSVCATLWGELGYLCDPYDLGSVEDAIRRALGSNTRDGRNDSRYLRDAVLDAFGHPAFDARLRRLMEQ